MGRSDRTNLGNCISREARCYATGLDPSKGSRKQGKYLLSASESGYRGLEYVAIISRKTNRRVFHSQSRLTRTGRGERGRQNFARIASHCQLTPASHLHSIQIASFTQAALYTCLKILPNLDTSFILLTGMISAGLRKITTSQRPRLQPASNQG